MLDKKSNADLFIIARRGLPAIKHKLLHNVPLNDSITVAFLGGSITEGAGATDAETSSWRALTGSYLQGRYVNQSFRFINAGVGGTDSTLGAHRLHEHVLRAGRIDLLFVEFSVNDGNDRDESIRGMEGIVRQCWRLSPETDICFLYTAAEKNLTGSRPFNIAVHEEVAGHYGIPSVNFAARIYTQIQAGERVWKELAPDGYHPNDAGHALYAGFLQKYLETALASDSMVAHRQEVSSTAPLDSLNYEYGMMLDGHGADYSEAFENRELKLGDPLMNWRFSTEHIYSDDPEASFSFTVTGQGAGLVLLIGPDTGIFEYSVNGSPYTAVNMFDDWCLNAYRPLPAMFPIRDQREKLHVTVRNTGMKDERSLGSGLRILKLLCN
ncbi:SGNH/GDSL hydrolase family protein [Paenibacillus monticola]|nr:SGNH/GDSL hydrolase family protein [Paenibacillus monticola]